MLHSYQPTPHPATTKSKNSVLSPANTKNLPVGNAAMSNKNSKISLEKFHVHCFPCLVVLLEVQKVLDAGLVEGKAGQVGVLFLGQHVAVFLAIGLRRGISLGERAELSHGIDAYDEFFIRDGLQIPLAGANLTDLCIDIKLDSLQVMHDFLFLPLTKHPQLPGLELPRCLHLQQPAINEGNQHNDQIILILLLTNQQNQSLKLRVY